MEVDKNISFLPNFFEVQQFSNRKIVCYACHEQVNTENETINIIYFKKVF